MFYIRQGWVGIGMVVALHEGTLAWGIARSTFAKAKGMGQS